MLKLKPVLAVCILVAVVPRQGTSQEYAPSLTRQPRKELVNVEDYLTKVFGAFDQKVRDFGVGNLPLHDFTLVFNETKDDILLRGKVTYSSGFITQMEPITTYLRFLRAEVSDEYAYISAECEMPNITVLYMMEAQLSTGVIMGTSENTFPNNRFSFEIYNDFATNKLSMQYLSPSSISAPKPVQVPETDVTTALGKRAKLQFSTELWKDMESWIKNTFQSMFDSILPTILFPLE